MTTQIDTIGNVKIIRTDMQSIDAGNADEFKSTVLPMLDNERSVLLDFENVTFVDSAGLGAILSCIRKVYAQDGIVRICQTSPAVRSLFELVRIHRIVDIINTREEALRTFR